MRDEIFMQDIGKQFEFDEQVASVFDDMLERSVPHYKEVVGLIVDFCKMNICDNASVQSSQKALIYDLGSSTGTTLLALWQAMSGYAEFIGIDNSRAMIDRANLKAKAYGAEITFIHKDILAYEFLPCSCVIASYILQFIRPMQRQALLQNIYNALNVGGVFFLSEKMTSHHRILDRQMIERYLRYKMQQGYTQGEISKKREALENVLVPFSLEENINLLKNVGFVGVEVLFKWVNFGTIIAKK